MRIRIRDPESFRPGIRNGKIRIQYKYHGSSTLVSVCRSIRQCLYRFPGSAVTTLSSFCRICWQNIILVLQDLLTILSSFCRICWQRWTRLSGRQRNCCSLSWVDCLSPSLQTKVCHCPTMDDLSVGLTIYLKSNNLHMPYVTVQ